MGVKASPRGAGEPDFKIYKKPHIERWYKTNPENFSTLPQLESVLKSEKLQCEVKERRHTRYILDDFQNTIKISMTVILTRCLFQYIHVCQLKRWKYSKEICMGGKSV